MHITAISPAMELPVDQDPGADPGADEHERARLVSAGRPLPVLAEHGEVHVVLDQHRRAQRALQDLAHGHVRPPLQVRREGDDAGVGVHGARRARRHHQEARHGRVRVAHQGAQVGGDPGQERGRADPGRRGHDAVRDPVAAQVGDGESGARGTEVDAGDVSVPRVELHERGTPSPARRPRAEVLHHAAADQVRGQAADGGRGEPGGGDELRSRERSRAVHGHVQHTLEVQPAQMPRMTRSAVDAARGPVCHVVPEDTKTL
jgi:hypothetical protein